ncbi:hypothetical protein M1771_03370 [Spiroplasma citri]|uniref:hypothetical protein n=1 Tax=Spiroplasma citri TaxID=2133 RepID=UPI002412651F|nr:hypothetical protein [Spiroplasma citri]WFH00955.1 hypothetical protein M1771_03370 [Spiroplasma citri]
MPYKIESSVKYVKSRLKEMTPQDKPFNEVDNKYYFVVWRSDKNDDWKIIKFNNNEKIKRWHPKTLDVQNNIKLCLTNYAEIPIDIDLSIDASTINRWKNDNGTYIKSVYRWNGGEEWSPILAYDGGMIKFWVWKDFKTWDKAQRGIVTTAAIGLRAFGSWEPLIW